MSANVDVECRQGSLQMPMKMSEIHNKKCQKMSKNDKKCQFQAPGDDAQMTKM